MPPLTKLILLQLTINQFILNPLLPVRASTVNQHHLNYHSFEQLNSAIYHQLLAVETESGPGSFGHSVQRKSNGVAIGSQNSNNKNQKSFNNDQKKQTDQTEFDKNSNLSTDSSNQITSFINQTQLFKSNPILRTAHTPDSSLLSRKTSPSSQISSSSIKNPNKLDHRSVSLSNNTSFIGTQFDPLFNKQSFSTHQLIENHSDPFVSTPNPSTAASRNLKQTALRQTPMHQTTGDLLNQQPFNNLLSTIHLSNVHHLSNGTRTNQRSTRSSNNSKSKELVRRTQCESNKDCPLSNVCEPAENMCKCPKGYINLKDVQAQEGAEQVNWPPTHCYEATQLEKPCIYDEQCIVKHSKCTRGENLGEQLNCACTLGYASKGRLMINLINLINLIILWF